MSRARNRNDALERRRRALASSDAGGPPQFYVAPVGKAPAADGVQVPDLLHQLPREWGDLRGATELVRFAFEGGDCEGVFDTLIEAVPLPSPSISIEELEHQLHLPELLRSCFQLRTPMGVCEPNTRALRRMLSCPPTDARDLELRQNVLVELCDRPTARDQLSRAYENVLRLRSALEMSATSEPNLVRRKIGALSAVRDCLTHLASSFEGSPSALARLREWAERVVASEAFTQLSELVTAEGHLASVDLRVRLGSDGTIRQFDVLSIRSRPSDSLPSPLRRAFERLTAFLRGHRYGESDVVLRLLEGVFAPLANEVVALLALTASLEFYLSALSFRARAREANLEVSLPHLVVPGSSTERILDGLWNPLLLLQERIPVACSLPAMSHDRIVVITGPNSGGKTRLLQSIAFAQLLGQTGMFVPASRAVLISSSHLFLSLVHDVDAAQPEGRLGTELARIRALFEQLSPGGVALLDELCSGTNPKEGEEIFELVVSLLPELGAQVFVSTHFLSLAERLERERPELAFLQVELDQDENPTFQFVPGVATTSLAHRAATRLGVTEQALRALLAGKRRPQPTAEAAAHEARPLRPA